MTIASVLALAAVAFVIEHFGRKTLNKYFPVKKLHTERPKQFSVMAQTLRKRVNSKDE